MLIDDDAGFVKSQIEHHARTAAWHASNKREEKEARHRGLQKRFQELHTKIRYHMNNPPAPKIVSNEIGNRLGDLSDLPEEIKNQLVSVHSDEYEEQVLSVLKNLYGGIANVDELFVGMFRKYEIKDKDREYLARKLYRMTKSKTIFSVPKKKGIYSIAPPETAGKPSAKKPEVVNRDDIIGGIDQFATKNTKSVE
jgi:hypothetical protein